MDERSELIAKRFEVPMLVAAVLVVPVLVAEEANVAEPWSTVTEVANWAIWVAFFTEVAVMLWVVPEKLTWIRQHPLEVAIVVLTVPAIVANLAGLRLLRLLRVLRLLRLAVLVRRAFSLEGLKYVALLALVTLAACAVGYASVEPHRSITEGFYWAFTTMTTVGYGGDPATTTGKLLTVLAVLVGVSFVAVLTGAVASYFLEPKVEEVGEEVEEVEIDVLAEIRDLSVRLASLELAVRDRLRARPR